MSFAFMPIYTGDYLRDTRHLTPLKHGIYYLLLMHCWDSKGPLPLDEQECAGIANCRSADEVDALRYIVARFFVRMEDGHYNRRMQIEVERAESISRARSDAGRLGYQAKAKHLLSKSQASASTPTPTPTLTPTNTKSTGVPPPAPPGFLAFWAAYPNLGRRKNKATCLALWNSRGLEAEAAAIVAHVEAMKRTAEWCPDSAGDHFEPEAERYLRKRNWEDGLPDSVSRRVRLAL